MRNTPKFRPGMEVEEEDEHEGDEEAEGGSN